MFPNPQDALPLPTKPSTERYKKLANELIKACKSAAEDAIADWAANWVTSVIKRSGIKITKHLPVRADNWIKQVDQFAKRTLLAQENPQCRVADAQFIIARSHGFLSWRKFIKHLDDLSLKGSRIARFELAADAIISGDSATLKRLLQQDPKLVKMRSTREHRATLLHYVSANGIEGYRQKTPKNVVKIARLLLEAGAEVDAEADVYGGGATTLGLAATSVHPYRVGVQIPLLEILLDHGAQLEHPRSGGNQQTAVTGCLANGQYEAAIFLADRGARLDLESAAGIGRLAVVQSYFAKRGKPSRKQVEAALLLACGWGQADVVQFLLSKGVDLGAKGNDGQTGLHWAVIGGQLQIVKLLLQHRPPLEVKNMYGGTVLGQTLWSAAHGGDEDDHVAIIEALIAAGAKVPPRHVPVSKRIDELLSRYGSIPEPTWYWFGEEPRRPKVLRKESRGKRRSRGER